MGASGEAQISVPFLKICMFPVTDLRIIRIFSRNKCKIFFTKVSEIVDFYIEDWCTSRVAPKFARSTRTKLVLSP